MMGSGWISGPNNRGRRVWVKGDLMHAERFFFPLPAAPANTLAPAITGTLGVGLILSVTNGTWTGSSINFSRQWRSSGVNIPGATALTYTQQAADVGAFIDCVVLASGAGGQTLAGSNVVGPVP